MMRLRMKIFSGFVLLVVVLFVAGAWSIYELNGVGTSVQRILDDDYAGIHGARMMIEALEREDSGILLLLLGRWTEGRKIIAAADSLFEAGYRQARETKIEAGDDIYFDEIRTRYDAYKALWIPPIVGTAREGDLTWYFETLHGAFLDVRGSVGDLLDHDDQVMYQTATALRNRSSRAIMPGVIAVIAAFGFTLIFNFFVNFYVVGPMVRIHRGIQRFLGNGVAFDVEVETSDEIADLARDVERLCLRVVPGEAAQ